MKVIASLVTLAAASQAVTFCPTDKILFFDGNTSGTDYAFCGGNLATNCGSLSENAWCGLFNSSTFWAAQNLGTVCCNATEGAAYDIAVKDTCESCLKDNTASSLKNTWDGSNCYNSDGNALAFTLGMPIYDDKTKCPVNCYSSDFIGTCWRRCGTRGWGVDPSKGYGAYITGQTYGGYGYMSYGAYGAYGSYGQGGAYGAYGAYGMGAYGGYGYGAYYTPYGMSPSIYGTPCPDPKQISQFPSTPAYPQWGYYGAYGMGGYGYGGMYGGMYGQQPYYGGMYGNTMSYGYPQTSVYGGMGMGMGMGMGSPSYVGSVYGRQFVGSVYGGAAAVSSPYVGSVYGGSATYGGVYGGSVYGGSVYGGQSQTGEHRCDAALQCSCDTNCCARGDCCKDAYDNSCIAQR